MTLLQGSRTCLLFQASFSLPGSPYINRRRSRPSRKSLKLAKHLLHHAEKQPLVHLESLNLPYADDSNAVTPSSDDIRLCNLPSKFSILARRASFASSLRRQREDISRRGSNVSQGSRSSRSRLSPHEPDKLTKLETAFNLKNKGHRLLPEVVVDRTKLDKRGSDAQVYTVVYRCSQNLMLLLSSCQFKSVKVRWMGGSFEQQQC